MVNTVHRGERKAYLTKKRTETIHQFHINDEELYTLSQTTTELSVPYLRNEWISEVCRSTPQTGLSIQMQLW